MNPLLLSTLLLVSSMAAHAANEVSNTLLTVRFDEATERFSVAKSGEAKPFIIDGKLRGLADSVARKDVADPQFGAGEAIVVAFKDGGSASLEVYPNLPFVLVRETLTNTTANEIDHQRVVPATFTVDLGKSASALTTAGTGGLLTPAENPGSYLFLALADPATRRGVVTGFISQYRGSGVIFPKVADGQVIIEPRLDHGHLILAPKQTTVLDTLAIGYFDDARIGLEQFADAVAKAHKINLRPKTAVYCTWYVEGENKGGAGTPETTQELATFINDKKLQDYGLTVIQIDDRWQDGPVIGGPASEFDRVNPNGPYKAGIAPVAEALAGKNLTLGLWWLPFGRNHMEPQYQDNQDWFFKWPDGKPLRQKNFGGSCLDATNPEVQSHIESLARTIRSWGVKYYKMDGLSAGAGVDHYYINDYYKEDRFGESLPLHDRNKTHIEAIRMGLASVRKGAGDDVFFSACAAVQNMRMYAGTIGLVDAMRVGPDFNHDGQGIRSGPLRGSWVYFLNGKVWWNDPDPTKVRTSNEKGVADGAMTGGVTLEQAQLTSSWVALANQFFLISDWLPDLPEERLDILKKTMAPHHATARPVDYFDNRLPNTWLVSDTSSATRRDVLGLFNFYDKPLPISHTFEKIGLDPSKTYHAFDYWNNQLMTDVSVSYQETISPNSCRVVALRASEGRPLVISSSRHVTQGMIDITGETWANDTLTGKSLVIANEPYELRVRVPAGWELNQASAMVAGKKLETKTVAHPGLVRVGFTPTQNSTVDWKISFKPVPKAAKALILDLKATQSSPLTPVVLTWRGSSPFYQIARNGMVVASSQSDEKFEDAEILPGQAITYTVRALNGSADPAELATATITAKDIEPVPAPPMPETSLSDLEPVTAKIGHGKLMPDTAVNGTPLSLSGTKYPDGIGIHAGSKLTYACKPEWKQFVATVGIDDSQRHDPRASIICSVSATDAAGKETVLAKTPVLDKHKTYEANIDVAVPSGTTSITLHIDDAGDGIACDHSSWVNAGFLTRASFARTLPPIYPLSTLAPAAPPGVNSATYAVPKMEWTTRVMNTNARAHKIADSIQFVFDGDSITDGWQGAGKAIWEERYAKLGAFNFGIGGDRTQHVLWRLAQGQVDGIHPKLIVLMIGTNNLGDNTAAQIADGVKTIVADYQKRCPDAVILLQAIFPRSQLPADPFRLKIKAINEIISKLGDGKKVIYIDFGDKFLEADGTMSKEVMHDFLHPSPKGYQIWADAIQPIIDQHSATK